MVIVYKIDTASGFLGVANGGAIATYIQIAPTPGEWNSCNYGITGTGGAKTLEIICNFDGSSNTTNIYGIATFNSEEEAAAFAQYLEPVLGTLP